MDNKTRENEQSRNKLIDNTKGPISLKTQLVGPIKEKKNTAS